MTFDREPDLDNANVGMPDTRILGITKYIKEVTKSVASFFICFVSTKTTPSYTGGIKELKRRKK